MTRLLILSGAILALAGCDSGGSVDTAELSKEIPPVKNPNTNFSEKMEKYKIGGPNSPPGLGGQGPQTPKKGG